MSDGLLQGIVVILVRSDGAANVGSVARLCGNFGVELRLVAPNAELACKEAWRMAHPCEADLDAAPRFADLHAALHDVTLSVGTSGKMRASAMAPPLDVERCKGLLPAPGERTALVFGNERTGLSLDESKRCDRLVRLPTPGPVESYNLASAVAVTLSICLGAAGLSQPRRAPRAGRDALQVQLELQLDRAGFFARTERTAFAPRLREMVDKMDISERDATLLIELLACIGGARDAAADQAP